MGLNKVSGEKLDSPPQTEKRFPGRREGREVDQGRIHVLVPGSTPREEARSQTGASVA